MADATAGSTSPRRRRLPAVLLVAALALLIPDCAGPGPRATQLTELRRAESARAAALAASGASLEAHDEHAARAAAARAPLERRQRAIRLTRWLAAAGLLVLAVALRRREVGTDHEAFAAAHSQRAQRRRDAEQDP